MWVCEVNIPSFEEFPLWLCWGRSGIWKSFQIWHPFGSFLSRSIIVSKLDESCGQLLGFRIQRMVRNTGIHDKRANRCSWYRWQRPSFSERLQFGRWVPHIIRSILLVGGWKGVFSRWTFAFVPFASVKAFEVAKASKLFNLESVLLWRAPLLYALARTAMGLSRSAFCVAGAIVSHLVRISVCILRTSAVSPRVSRARVSSKSVKQKRFRKNLAMDKTWKASMPLICVWAFGFVGCILMIIFMVISRAPTEHLDIQVINFSSRVCLQTLQLFCCHFFERWSPETNWRHISICAKADSTVVTCCNQQSLNFWDTWRYEDFSCGEDSCRPANKTLSLSTRSFDVSVFWHGFQQNHRQKIM